MARRANRDSVEKVANGPDFESALGIIKTIWTDQSESSTISGEIGAKWKRIEGLGVSKVGAQMYAKVAKMEDAIQADVMRTFIALSIMSGVMDKRDLVDQMEGHKTLGEAAADAASGDTAAVPDAMDDFDAADPKLKADDAPAGDGSGKPAGSDFKPDLKKQEELEAAKAKSPLRSVN